MNPIAILTDFGTEDSYVGEMKGVVSGIAPGAALIDITHAIPAGDIQAAALTLWRALPAFPPQTVFLVVVDPGVGTARRPLAVRILNRTIIAPDNGVISYLLASAEAEEMVEIHNPAILRHSNSQTFHGRDLFSPAAAHVATGMPLAELGAVCGDPVQLSMPLLETSEDHIKGEVLHKDHFGNLTTSIGALTRVSAGIRLEPWCQPKPGLVFNGNAFSVILPDQTMLSLHTTFADVARGSGLAYIGSAGLLEVAVRQGNAARAFELEPGAKIVLERKE